LRRAPRSNRSGLLWFLLAVYRESVTPPATQIGGIRFARQAPRQEGLVASNGRARVSADIKAGSLERQRGFMPMRLRRKETGVEFDVFEGPCRAPVRCCVAQVGAEPACELNASSCSPNNAHQIFLSPARLTRENEMGTFGAAQGRSTTMSIEIHVFFRGKLPDKKALSQAMAELGFPLTIKAGSLERQRGFMPMGLRREETGVEFDVFDGRSAVEEQVADIGEIAAGDIDPRFERSANFRWGGDEDEMLAGLCAAAALAKLVDGVVFDAEGGNLLSVDGAIALARETLAATLRPKRAPRRGTRPADIKRYLKALLKQRSDLVVIDRMVLVRPVRHFLRGAFLDRTSDKYTFKVLPYLKPLWSPAWRLEILGSIYSRAVWQPYFEPLLIDTLQHDIFMPLGTITTHDDLVGALSDRLEFFTTRVCALVLIGERERAEDCVRDLENSEYGRRCQDWIKSARDLLARNIREVCAEFHANEAKAVKAMKLQSIWEPSPFPVEVPATERKSRTAEPLFVPEPWLPRPPGLWLGVPEVPGEVRFAEDWQFGEKEHPLLVAPLTRAEAEDRHQNGEDYMLAARLPDGRLLLLAQQGRDRRDPARADLPHPPSPEVYAGGFYFHLHGAHFRATAHVDKYHEVDGMLEVSLVKIDDRIAQRTIWAWQFYRPDAEVTIRDHRGGEPVQRKNVTDAEMDRFTFPKPAFGDLDAIVRFVLDTLRSQGYGELE
jgi:hypothetical protein